jgi:hypothetical protein
VGECGSGKSAHRGRPAAGQTCKRRVVERGGLSPMRRPLTKLGGGRDCWNGIVGIVGIVDMVAMGMVDMVDTRAGLWARRGKLPLFAASPALVTCRPPWIIVGGRRGGHAWPMTL